MNEYGVGIIGFGFMGRTHTYAYRTIPFFYDNLPFKTKLVGVCSRTHETALKAKEEFGFEFSTSDSDRLLERDDIHIINICTPNDSHMGLLKRALKAGKHVYCDKPMTVSGDEALEVLEIIQNDPAAGELVTQMAFQYRFFPSVMRARQMIDEGLIGTPISFRSCYLHSSSVDQAKPAGWRYADNSKGGGVIFDLGSHLFDMIYYLMGEFDSITVKKHTLHASRMDKSGNLIRVNSEDYFMAMAEMKNGALGTLEASKIATGMNNELRLEIHGDKGAIRFNLADPDYLEYYDNNAPDKPFGGTRGFLKIDCLQQYEKPGGIFPQPKVASGWLRAHVHSLYNFLSSVDGGVQTSPSLIEGAYIQYVMEKAFESDRLHSRIEL